MYQRYAECHVLDKLFYLPLFFFFNDTATTEIYTLSLHDALPISGPLPRVPRQPGHASGARLLDRVPPARLRRAGPAALLLDRAFHGRGVPQERHVDGDPVDAADRARRQPDVDRAHGRDPPPLRGAVSRQARPPARAGVPQRR